MTVIESDGRLEDTQRTAIQVPPGKWRRVLVANVVGGGTENKTDTKMNSKTERPNDRELVLGVVKGRVIRSGLRYFWRWNGPEQITAARDGSKTDENGQAQF
jgi:hypothetical protein